MKKIIYNFKGFTLLEFIVVVIIIALLASAVLVTFYNVRQSARDTRRVVSISQMRDVLEAYYRDESMYPPSLNFIPGSIFESSSLVYMAKVPNNPEPRIDGDCPDTDFVYAQTDSGVSYTITFCLGGKSGDLLAGTNVATPMGIINQP